MIIKRMEYGDWKKHKKSESATKSDFTYYQKIYQFVVTRNHQEASYLVVKGICQTPDCDNFYEKTFRVVATNTGPYCVPCIRGSSLLRLYPDIAKTIVHSDLPISQLCCGSNRKVIFRCTQHCFRCLKQHEYEMGISNRVNGYSCSICSGHNVCPCQKDDEFKCSICKFIKSKTQNSYGNICKSCDSKKHNDNMPKFLAYLVQDCLYRGKNKTRKQGDLSLAYVLNMYQVQQQRCYITNVPLVAGHHRSWKVSIERVLDDGGYDNMNVVLIVLEMQNGNRKWNRALWDEVCSLFLGVQSYIPDETEFIQQQVANARQKQRRSGYMIQRHEERINSHGQKEVKCKYCHQFLTLEHYQRTKIGYCRQCRHKKDTETVKNTLRGRASICLKQSKIRSTKRKNDASEHTLTFDDILDIYQEQRGRCYYSKIPLAFTGFFQMSLERLDSRQGYTRENTVLIILGLNAGDWCSLIQYEDDELDEEEERTSFSRDKLLFAVQQNPREIVSRVSYVKDCF